MLLAGGYPSTAKTSVLRCSFRQELHAFGANDHRQVPVLPLLMRCKCAESTNQYWDKTCLQLSSIQGTDLDMAEVFVEKFNGIEWLML